MRRRARTAWSAAALCASSWLRPSLSDTGEVSHVAVALAAPKKAKVGPARPAVPPASPKAEPQPPTRAQTPTTSPAAAYTGLTTAELLAKARALYASLEYEDVVTATQVLLAREDAPIAARLDAYLMQGSALAIVGDPVEAEKPFRFLLRGRPDHDMSGETPPKILAVFRKVQVEERAIAEQMRELERARVLRELRLESDVPREATGGVPLPFAFRLRDPGRAVQSMNVHYRRSGAGPFSALALNIDESGAWVAQLPGEWTENDQGFTLEYFVTTKDAQGRELVTTGAAVDPLKVHMAAGTVSEARRIYQSPWFWVAVGAAVAATGAGGFLLYRDMTKLPETDALVRIKQ